jgi:hypothetical protein
MKILFALLVLILLTGCMSPKPYRVDIAQCNSDADCVPMPMCHPDSCINKEFTDEFPAPEICTTEYVFCAAYSKEDCVCKNNRCYNSKLDDPNC